MPMNSNSKSHWELISARGPGERAQPQRGTMKVLRNNAVWRAREGEAGAGSRSLTVWSSPQVQLTDFENSAYVVFVVLLTRVILSYKLDFLIPLSKVMMGG